MFTVIAIHFYFYTPSQDIIDSYLSSYIKLGNTHGALNFLGKIINFGPFFLEK